MKDIPTIGFAALFMVLGLGLFQACSGMTEKGMIKEKGGAMMDKEKAMMETKSAVMEKENIAARQTANLIGADNHHAAGTVTITKEKTGRSILTLADIRVDRVPDGRVYLAPWAEATLGVDGTILTLADIRVDPVPDGRVYLAKGGDYSRGVELGKLTEFSGTVTYSIPAGVRAEDYDSVVIWCKKFNVEIGHAFFERGMMKTDVSMMEHEKDMIGTDKGMMR